MHLQAYTCLVDSSARIKRKRFSGKKKITCGYEMSATPPLEKFVFNFKLFLHLLCVVYKAMPVLFFYLVVDSTKCITINILRSTGRPKITVWGNTVSCLAIMLPLGRILSVKMQYGNNSKSLKIFKNLMILKLDFLSISLHTSC